MSAYLLKSHIRDPRRREFVFEAQRTMYGGKHIAVGDVVYLFASETQGGPGLIARGKVTSARRLSLKPGVRQTPLVSVTIRRTALARRALGRDHLKMFKNWKDGRPETELNFKFYRQATNKIGGVSARAAAYLDGFF